MRNLVLFAFAFSCATAHGQDVKPDYVVTIKNDTLRGTVTIFTYDIIDRVQVVQAREKKGFTAIQVRAVSLNNEIYNPVATDLGFMMMKLVTPGFLSLYLGHQPKGSVYEIPYLVKKTGKAMEVPNLSFKKYMTEFLDECYTVKERVKSGELGKRDIDKIVEEFNICTAKAAQQTAVAVSSADPRLAPLSDLKARLEKDDSLAVRKDALDILQDISEKVKSNQAVPNYLLEGLKSQLKDAPAYQQDLEKVLGALKTQ